MKNAGYKTLLLNPIVLSSLGAVVVIAAASVLYYTNSTRVPVVSEAAPVATSTSVTGSGVVLPAENPNLAFASGGRVTSVRAQVGDSVSQGEVLASLDTASLSAQRAQAQANVDAATAQLAQMLAGARDVDVTAKQTAIDQANTALTNAYTSAATAVIQSYDTAFSGLSQNTDNLFNQPNSSSPTLIFTTSDSQSGISAVSDRAAAEAELIQWQKESNALSSSPSQTQVDTALNAALAHLQVIRAYNDQLLVALSSAVPSNTFPQSAVAAAQAAIATYRNSLNSDTSTLLAAQQQIATDRLNIQSATNALNQVTASATPDQIAAQQAAIAAAQANVENIDAQINNDVIVAPFSGTVASVQVKVGDIVSANTPAISLNPRSALQINVYFSEIDVTKLHVGDTASVTLDAYGNSRTFDAEVVSIDTAPSQEPGGQSVLGYKVTLQFAKSDPSITTGMTANVTIPIN